MLNLYFSIIIRLYFSLLQGKLRHSCYHFWRAVHFVACMSSLLAVPVSHILPPLLLEPLWACVRCVARPPSGVEGGPLGYPGCIHEGRPTLLPLCADKAMLERAMADQEFLPPTLSKTASQGQDPLIVAWPPTLGIWGFYDHLFLQNPVLYLLIFKNSLWVSLLSLILFKCFVCTGVWPACISVYHMPVPAKARRHWILGNWSYSGCELSGGQ